MPVQHFTAPPGSSIARGELIEPIAYGIDAAAQATDTSRDTIYRAIARDELTARKIGSRTVILAEELRAWLMSRPAIKPRKVGQGA